MTLKEAVELVRQLAPDDGWLVYVTGWLSRYLNALIPSLEDAVTYQNYKKRRRQARRSAAWEASTTLGTDARKEDEDRQGTHLYTGRVDFGIVTSSTWQVVQALPPDARAEYERLRVEAVVFYPWHLIARSGEEYDRLVRDYPEGDLPWETVLDKER
jgi:hypothetical protein